MQNIFQDVSEFKALCESWSEVMPEEGVEKTCVAKVVAEARAVRVLLRVAALLNAY